MKSFGFYFDSQKCVGCKTCQVACQDMHNHPTSINFRRVYEYAGGEWVKEGKAWRNDVFAYYISVACNHCDEPACTKACPTGAMHKKDNGLVVVDEAKCIGCKNCIVACPYGAPQFNVETKRTVKCDACEDRVANGQKPVCVESCIMRALDFGEVKDLQRKYGESKHMAPLPSPDETRPNLLIKPSTNAQPVGDKKGAIVNSKEV